MLPSGQRLNDFAKRVIAQGHLAAATSYDAAPPAKNSSHWERMPTMRKDLHVGLAIGGVLLAVLIVWGVVVNHGKQHKAVTLDTTAPGNTGSEIPPAPPAT